MRSLPGDRYRQRGGTATLPPAPGTRRQVQNQYKIIPIELLGCAEQLGYAPTAVGGVRFAVWVGAPIVTRPHRH